MKGDTLQGLAETTFNRREILKTTTAVLVPLATRKWTSKPDPAPQTAPEPAPTPGAYVPPSRQRGTAVRNVRDYGALGNGTRDDTSSFQAAIDSLPVDGGTVVVPAGRYVIDPVKSIRLRNRMLLQLASDATLLAKPNSAEKAYVIYAYGVSEVEIAGGQVVGDRYSHLGTTGEWGHAIFVRGSSHVTVRDIRLSDCWGDGMSIGAKLVYNAEPISSNDVVVANVVSTNNRRQGLSIGRSTNVVVRDSEFSNSNGTAPECGIDIEPDSPGITDGVSIENCLFRGNNKYGLLAYKRAQNVTIRRCTIEANNSCGLVTVGAINVVLEANNFRLNSATGLLVEDGTNGCTVSGNSFYGNYARNGVVDRTDFTMSGWASKIERDILMRGTTSGVSILVNTYL